MVAEIESAKAVPDARAFLLKLFASRFGSRLSSAGTDVWRSLSQFHALSDEEMLAAIENGSKTYRALCLDDREAFLLFSFSPQGRQEDVATWQAFTEGLARLGVNSLRLFQLSETGDYQVYLHFEKLSKIAPLCELFSAYLAASGLARVQVHGPGDYFVLPLQSGFRWMNEAVQPVVARREMSLEVACNFFLAELLKSTICPQLLTEKLEQELSGLKSLASAHAQADEAELALDEQNESALPHIFEPTDISELQAVCQAEMDEPAAQEVFAAELEIIAAESAVVTEALVSSDEPEMDAIFQREEFLHEEPAEVQAEELADQSESDIELSAASVERLFQLDPLDEGQPEMSEESPTKSLSPIKSLFESLVQPEDISEPQVTPQITPQIDYLALREEVTQLEELAQLDQAPSLQAVSQAVLTVSSDSSIVPAAYGDIDDLQIEADSSRPMRYVQLYFPFAEGLVKPTYFEEMPVRRPTKRRGRICLPD